MPITIACPSCAARLTAPDQAAGKAVRCPKCQAPVPVPKPPAADEGFEVVDDAPPAPPKPASKSGERPRPRPADDDAPAERPSQRPPAAADDEDDRPSKRRPAAEEEAEDDDRPARSKARRPADDEDRPRRKGPAGGKNLKHRGLIAGVAGGVLFVGLIAASMYQMSAAFDSIADRDQRAMDDIQRKMNRPMAFNPPNPNANVVPPPNPDPKPPAATVPAGWEKFTDPLAEMDLYFPGGQPTKNQDGSDKVTKATGGPGDIWAKEANGKVYMLSRMTASPAEVRRRKPEALLFDALKGFAMGIPGAKQGNYELPTFDGGKVSRYVTYDIPTEGKRAVVRGLAAGNRVVMVIVIGPANVTAKDADVAPFLDNAKLLK